MSKTENRTWILGLLAVVALVYSSFFFVQPINLTTADLGRHITNGELIVNGLTDVLDRNYYSFTEPDHTFTNHHWGSGVVFYYLHKLVGFKGLSVWYVLMNLLALTFMVLASTKSKDRFAIPIISAISVIMVLGYRVEVRPEGFSYALIAAYFFLFNKLRDDARKIKWIVPVLLLLQVFWVNLHIFFFLGFVVAGAFLVDAAVNRKSELKNHTLLLLGLICVSFINPHLHVGVLAPLTIFNEYGYMVAENQTLFFMYERFGNAELTHFGIFGVVAIGLTILSFVKGVWRQKLPELLLLIAFTGLSIMAVRGIPLFALFFIPVPAGIINKHVDELNFKTKNSVLKVLPIAGIAFCSLFIALKGTYASARTDYRSIGLIEGINGCGEFMKANNIGGNIFNNYDIGSYLIYHLHDREKVFVDNRPEAYSVAFFDSIYKPMQQHDAIWNKKVEEYNLNVICFYRHDNTPWAQPFLIRRTQDQNWVPIYVDLATIILVRNKDSNRRLIQQYAIDRKVFSGVPN